ncbi:uncharacterized protein ACA1_067690 [Acanthamoeba castellanii str. Neff]|uniref:Uncharacterized protein n=1 Tax=Acanthamoeba castellanii (strain ATCC 30010 / Neff) TaxID=1257118 RepID=L8HDD4_ACACF|nr:uncharacterized protein ACA1_067690 [Acanthamoeba castellanii str. Neff]ELR23185.1 hypothetical protein ACA1_067690 [Acanthamoeba castellanii str. Neff]
MVNNFQAQNPCLTLAKYKAKLLSDSDEHELLVHQAISTINEHMHDNTNLLRGVLFHKPNSLAWWADQIKSGCHPLVKPKVAWMFKSVLQWLATTGDGSADLMNVEEGNGGLDNRDNDAGEANAQPDTDTELIHKEYELEEEVIEEEENRKHDECNCSNNDDGSGGSDDNGGNGGNGGDGGDGGDGGNSGNDSGEGNRDGNNGNSGEGDNGDGGEGDGGDGGGDNGDSDNGDSGDDDSGDNDSCNSKEGNSRGIMMQKHIHI